MSPYGKKIIYGGVGALLTLLFIKFGTTFKEDTRRNDKADTATGAIRTSQAQSQATTEVKYQRLDAFQHDMPLMQKLSKKVVDDAKKNIADVKKDIEAHPDGKNLETMQFGTDEEMKTWFAGILKWNVSQLEEEFYRTVGQKEVDCKKLVRLGSKADGGYWFCEDGNYRPKEPCLALSFGVGNIWNLLDDIEAKYKCRVHAFDPTMMKPDHQRSKLISFHPPGLYGQPFDFSYMKFKTLQQINKEHNPKNDIIDILKVDVEGSEWSALNLALKDGTLTKVRQLMFEYHAGHIHDFAKPSAETRAVFVYMLTMFKQLHKIGFRLYFQEENENFPYKSPYTGKKRPAFGNVNYLNANFK